MRTKFRLRRVLAAALFATALTASAAHAAPVLWTLQSVDLPGGGQITGSFVFDAVTSAYSDVNLTASGGVDLNNAPAPTFVATTALGYSGSIVLAAVPALLADLTNSPLIALQFVPANQPGLTNAGGLLGVFIAAQGLCANSACDSLINIRTGSGGNGFGDANAAVFGTPVPLPGAFGFMAASIVAGGVALQRRRAKAKAA